MGILLAHDADSRLTKAALHLEWVLRVDFAWWDELQAIGIRAEYSGLPGSRKLQNGFQEALLVLVGEEIFDDLTRNWLGATPGGHTRLVRSCAIDHDPQAVRAIGVTAR